MNNGIGCRGIDHYDQSKVVRPTFILKGLNAWDSVAIVRDEARNRFDLLLLGGVEDKIKISGLPILVTRLTIVVKQMGIRNSGFE